MPARRQPASKTPEAEPTLCVPKTKIAQEIAERLVLGQQLLSNLPSFGALGAQLELPGRTSGPTGYRHEFHTWDEHNGELLTRRFSSSKVADEYRRVAHLMSSTPQAEVIQLRQTITEQMRKLESIRGRLDLYEAGNTTAPEVTTGDPQGTKIFVVHGHDGTTKLEVAEFLETITEERPVILHEQPDAGQTIIEKFEVHASEAGFAVVLLTADDEGNAKGKTPATPRARQNVVLELGYFLGRLGRSRVVALYEEDIELPSDLAGLLYIRLSGNWHTALAKELRAAGIHTDLGKLG